MRIIILLLSLSYIAISLWTIIKPMSLDMDQIHLQGWMVAYNSTNHEISDAKPIYNTNIMNETCVLLNTYPNVSYIGYQIYNKCEKSELLDGNFMQIYIGILVEVIVIFLLSVAYLHVIYQNDQIYATADSHLVELITSSSDSQEEIYLNPNKLRRSNIIVKVIMILCLICCLSGLCGNIFAHYNPQDINYSIIQQSYLINSQVYFGKYSLGNIYDRNIFIQNVCISWIMVDKNNISVTAKFNQCISQSESNIIKILEIVFKVTAMILSLIVTVF